MKQSKQPFYEIANKAENHAEIILYGVIGDEFDGLDAKSFITELSQLDVEALTLRVNSPGGEVFAGVAMYNALKDHKAKVTVKIEALAASAASFVMLAGDEIEMADNASIMIHNPMTMAFGEAKDFVKVADQLDKVKSTIITTYLNHTNWDEQTLTEKMDAETWLTAEEALEAGFVTRIYGGKKVVNTFDLKKFKNTPENLLADDTPVEEECIEPEQDATVELSLMKLDMERLELECA